MKLVKGQMIKKTLIIVSILLLSQIFCSYSYAKKCKKCVESTKNDKSYYPEIGIACRDYETPVIRKDGKVYATYKCCYGHVYLVDLDE